jgi:hypothetical protein
MMASLGYKTEPEYLDKLMQTFADFDDGDGASGTDLADVDGLAAWNC